MMRPRRVHVGADLERLFADYLTHLACRAASLGLEITPDSPLLVNMDRVAVEVDGHGDRATGAARSLDSPAGAGLHRGEEPGQGVALGLALDEPNVAVRHGMTSGQRGGAHPADRHRIEPAELAAALAGPADQPAWPRPCSNTTRTRLHAVSPGQRPISSHRVPIICGSPDREQDPSSDRAVSGAENSAAARGLGFVVRQTSPPSDRQDRASWLSDCCI